MLPVQVLLPLMLRKAPNWDGSNSLPNPTPDGQRLGDRDAAAEVKRRARLDLGVAGGRVAEGVVVADQEDPLADVGDPEVGVRRGEVQGAFAELGDGAFSVNRA